MIEIKNLNKGDFFKLSEKANGKVYVRGNYVRENKMYSIYEYEDTNKERFIKGTKKVYTNFEY